VGFERVDSGVKGQLYAFTELRLGVPLGFCEDVPFCVGLVKIGGLLISVRINNATYDSLKIGDKVMLKVVELEEEEHSTDSNQQNKTNTSLFFIFRVCTRAFLDN